MRCAALCGTVLVLALAGCRSSGEPAAIDETAGAYSGVAIGDPTARMWRTFGRTRRADAYREPVSPLAAERYRGPTSFRLGPPFYRYRDVTFFVERGRVVGFMVVRERARTSRGVAVGDDLEKARSRYAQLRCGKAASGDFGSYPACTGRVAPHRYIWFGGDPIENITVGTRPLSGV